ncbi:tubulin--tyrosine ligase 12 [Octopus vulgaris]|uniref:Tubulin--tyrosine ligase 12 n=1 Tax=Octopus vulgaris TaxID=6645 RepID=A0AA36BTF5_OCTVU|nr:tubulin--tyrosine ligase 12 [Octopus vulgaris]
MSKLISSDNIDFDSFKRLHGPQLQTVPKRFWETLFNKLRGQVFDAGEMFTILLIDYDEEEEKDEEDNRPLWKVVTLSDMAADDGKHIYLIDHAWTYDVRNAEKHLKQIPSLVDRMASLMNIPVDEKSSDEIIQEILNKMWLYNQVYSFGHERKGSDEAMPLWYVMDEFGSRIQHSDDPSFAIAPFYYALDQLCYSVMFPLKDLQAKDEVSRNYLQKRYSDVEHSARLIPWQYSDLTDIDYIPKEPSDAYFYECRSKFTLPDEDEEPFVMNKDILKVYMDYDTMDGHLTDPRFVVVDDRDSADILFVKENLKNFKNLHQFVNQFPNECLVTVKDLLAVTGRRSELDRQNEDTLEYGPSWLPVTYNLNTELPQFVSYFQHRKKRSLANMLKIHC